MCMPLFEQWSGPAACVKISVILKSELHRKHMHFVCPLHPCLGWRFLRLGLHTVSLWPAHRQPVACIPIYFSVLPCPVGCKPSACGLHTVSLRPAHRQPVAFPFASLGLHTVSLWPAHRQPVACTSATAPSGIHGADAEGPNTQA